MYVEKIPTPCGAILEMRTEKGERKYYLDGELIWEPKKTHRVALQMAILKEDEIKYKRLREEGL